MSVEKDNKKLIINNIGVILAAGLGNRFHGERPKQFMELCGKSLLEYVLEAFKQSKETQKILVVLSEEEFYSRRVELEYNVETVCGGKTRPQSINNAIKYINEYYSNCTKVIFHDAARPLISADVFDNYFRLLKDYDYICTCQKITDSLGSYLDSIPKREDYFLLQSPEAYRFRLLYDNLDEDIGKLSNFYHSYLFPKTCKGYQCFDIKNNFKITYPDDLKFLQCWLESNPEYK